MNKKRGFTLIELLAVIVILAVIALIATPIIMNVINDAKVGANKDSVYGYIKAATYQLFNNNVDTDKVPVTYTINAKGQLVNGAEIIPIDSKGTKPSGGALTFNSNGQVGAAFIIDNKCYVKYLIEDDVRILPNSSKCDGDISSNLVVNGYGELGDNTNFSNFKYTNDGFTVNATIYSIYSNDTNIPVDSSKEYTLSVDLKTTDNTAIVFSGVSEYDRKQELIQAINFMYINNSLTSLTKDLNNGDTVVYLNNVSKFINATVDYNLGLIFWNYQDSSGKIWPPLTLSKNSWVGLYTASDIDRTNNTITLKKPWDKGTIKSGTEVSQTTSSGYNYGFINASTLTNTYTTKSYKIKGENINTGTNVFDKFRPGVKYIKFLSYPNYNGIAGNTTSIRNLSIRQSNG